MNIDQALLNMKAPGYPKPGKWRNGVIQIWLTRACDLSCYNCTQGSNLGGNPGMLSLENFDLILKCMKGYFGVFGIFGGNPALHPKFKDICEILADHVPWEQRGIWCNNPLGKAAIMRDYFNPRISNLNVHLQQEAYDEFKRDWPECNPVGLTVDSRHSPVWTAGIDMNIPEEQMWSDISKCDINHHWSGMFGQFRGEPRFYFCEIAGAQAMLHQHNPEYPDTGFRLDQLYNGKRCWELTMPEYKEQVAYHCVRCGVPYRGKGELAQSTDPESAEQVSDCHKDIFKPKRERLVQLVTEVQQISPKTLPVMVSYLENSRIK